MKSRHNFTSFLDDLDKMQPSKRYSYIEGSLAVLPVLWEQHGDRGYGMKLTLEALPTYEERSEIAEKIRHAIQNNDELNDVLNTLHTTQQEGYKFKQREFWRTLPCHQPVEKMDVSESPVVRRPRSKKRELPSPKFFAKPVEVVPVVRKKQKEVVRRTYDLRPRGK